MFFPLPAQFDIVYGKFPYPPNYTDPGPEPHACLVLDAFLQPVTGHVWVIVAMGTSKRTADLYSGEFLVNPTHRPDPLSGLTLPTKFSLTRSKVAKLPYNDEYFDVPPANRTQAQSTPRVGALNMARYTHALSAAGRAANTAQTIEELLSRDCGVLPP